ncbi:MAG: hypothetical protein A2016_02575 [Elusimicrobia bacterium GWF2_62_30]|nr:MAG: hypothetical protein A2016_02575 [Elusimicrobia bacterium GWF2_62_30]
MAGNAGAAGFRLAEQDAKANGMGNAFTAVADNASAVWYNPAALTKLDGINLSVGTVMVAPAMSHQNEVGSTAIEKIDNKLHIPPHFYVTKKIGQKFAVGAGVNAPFGLSSKWESTANTAKVATESEVKSVNYNLSGAYQATEKLSVAVGYSYAMVDATLNKRHPLAARDIVLKGDGTGTGYNAAVMYKHNEKWDFGATYHSKVKAKLEGDLEAVTSATSVTAVKTDLTLPDMLEIGAAYKGYANWLITVEADYTNWSTYRNIIIRKQSDNSLVSKDIKDWKSVWAFRIGAEHKLNDAWKIRTGAFYDMNPVTEKRFETRVPDSDRLAWSIGTGYTKGSVTVDASVLFLKFMERNINDSLQDSANQLNGKYNSSAILPGITASYKF